MDFILSSNNKSSNPSIETAGALAFDNKNTETAGSIALLDNKEDSSCGFDAFGGKDLFGNPDFSTMDPSSFAEGNLASANQAETAGSLACADSSASSGDCSGASVGADSGASGSCGGGSFSSVC